MGNFTRYQVEEYTYLICTFSAREQPSALIALVPSLTRRHLCTPWAADGLPTLRSSESEGKGQLGLTTSLDALPSQAGARVAG